MKKQYYPAYPGGKVYFTEADLSSQQLYRTTKNEFDVKMKLWLLFSDHLILSVGHLLRSPLTFDWLYSNQNTLHNLSNNQAILLSISDIYPSCSSFVDDQVKEPRNGLEFAYTPRDRAKFLDDLFVYAITWSPIQESSLFKSMIIRDLENNRSPLRRRMVGISNKCIVEMVNLINNANKFTRGTLVSLAQRYCPSREKTVTQYGDCYYYLSGALFKDAFPLFHSNAGELCREIVNYSARTDSGADDNISFWHKIMDRWGVPPCILEELSLEDVLSLRHSMEGKKVRKTMHGLLLAAHNAIENGNQLQEFIKARDKFFELFKSEVESQKNKKTKWGVGKGLLQITSSASTGIGIIAGVATANPVVGFAVGVLSFLAGLPIAGALEKRLGKTELVILAQKIVKKAKPN